MEVDSGTGHGQKRTTEEEIEGPDDGGDGKRSREEGGRNTTCEGYQSMDEDEDYYDDDSNFLDSYRTSWASNYGEYGSSFEDETSLATHMFPCT